LRVAEPPFSEFTRSHPCLAQYGLAGSGESRAREKRGADCHRFWSHRGRLRLSCRNACSILARDAPGFAMPRTSPIKHFVAAGYGLPRSKKRKARVRRADSQLSSRGYSIDRECLFPSHPLAVFSPSLTWVRLSAGVRRRMGNVWVWMKWHTGKRTRSPFSLSFMQNAFFGHLYDRSSPTLPAGRHRDLRGMTAHRPQTTDAPAKHSGRRVDNPHQRLCRGCGRFQLSFSTVWMKATHRDDTGGGF
jgi:hypothetical protein